MLSGVHNYRSTLDIITHKNLERRPVIWNFEAEFLEHSSKPGYTCMDLNARAFRIHLRKGLCVGSMSEIEFNVVSNFC